MEDNVRKSGIRMGEEMGWETANQGEKVLLMGNITGMLKILSSGCSGEVERFDYMCLQTPQSSTEQQISI